LTHETYDPAAHYDRVTEAWGSLLGDELHYGVFDTGDESLAAATAALTERMIEAAELRAGVGVLDVGCGTGAPACELARRFGARVVGITTSVVGASAAAARARSEGVDELARFEVRDGRSTDLPDASFDRVWALESSHLISDRAGLVAECARVLRPGGLLVLCDIVRMREIPFGEVRQRMDDFITLRAAFGDAHMEPLERYVEWSEAAGLVVEQREDLTAATLPTFARWRTNATRNGDAVAAGLGAEGLEAFVRATEILEGFWHDGTLGYGRFTARKPAG
jgi:cyclopropane fatty-acyl-phospholipid synthase-like methyltransferase